MSNGKWGQLLKFWQQVKERKVRRVPVVPMRVELEEEIVDQFGPPSPEFMAKLRAQYPHLTQRRVG